MGRIRRIAPNNIYSYRLQLAEFDVSSNNFGDDGARALFDALRYNSYLRVLHVDNNNIGWAGWLALRRCMNVNRALVKVKYPKHDINKVIANSR